MKKQHCRLLEPDYREQATDLINSGYGDSGRLEFIIKCLDQGKPLYNTDKRYLEEMTKMLDEKIATLQGSTKKDSKQKPVPSKVLLTDDDLDKIIERNNTKITTIPRVEKKEKSFFKKLFSRK